MKTKTVFQPEDVPITFEDISVGSFFSSSKSVYVKLNLTQALLVHVPKVTSSQHVGKLCYPNSVDVVTPIKEAIFK